MLNEGAGDTLTLYPYAASDERSVHTGHIAKGNAGNSLVDMGIKDVGNKGQSFDEVEIQVYLIADRQSHINPFPL